MPKKSTTAEHRFVLTSTFAFPPCLPEKQWPCHRTLSREEYRNIGLNIPGTLESLQQTRKNCRKNGLAFDNTVGKAFSGS
jgi:hypothetical protein